MPLSIVTVRATDLPAPPQSALQVVQACAQEDTDANKLGEIVSHDPVLTAELLRMANSAYFGFAYEVSSVARAVALIGQRALKNLVLCIAMRDALKPEQLPAFPVSEFWEASLRRAVAARCLAPAAMLDEDECFTVGLLQDFGLLVLLYLNNSRVSEWPRLAESLPDERYALERQLFANTHDDIGFQLAKSWQLPQELGLAIGFHHAFPPAESSEQIERMCRLSECVDWLAAIFTTQEKRRALKRCHSLLESHFGLDGASSSGLLEEISERMEQAGQAMGFEVGPQIGADSILREANLCLVEENLNFQEVNWTLEQALEERDRMAAELRRELELAREVQRSLLPDEGEKEAGIIGLNVSAKEVSGDFYDFFRLRTGQVAFCIADVSGKGMNAALLMAKTSSLYHCLGKSIHDPSKLLSMLNRELIETSIHGMFVTMVAGLLDPVSHKVRLSNAGHPPVFQMDGSKLVHEYRSTAPPLGIQPDAEFQVEEFQLGQHRLYLYTDGLSEMQGSGVRGGEELTTLLARHAERAPAERLQYLVADAKRETGKIADDITLLLIEGRTSE